MSDARQPAHPIHDQFTNRWSPRAFTGEVLPTEQLMSLFEAARWSPSASNLQPWRFVFASTGSEGFSSLLATLVPFNQDWAKKASALVVVLSARVAPGTEAGSRKPNRWHSFDTGAAWLALALQAHQQGLATHGMGGFDDAAVRQALQLSDDFAVEAVVAVGRQAAPDGLPEALKAREVPNQRQALDRIVAEFQPGQAFPLSI